MTDKTIADKNPILPNHETADDSSVHHISAINLSANSPAAPVPRHRAAIRRIDYSLPVKCLLRDHLFDPADSLFDYGCGHGDDLSHLQALGYDCDGWDPVHRPDSSLRPSDIVNLGFVLNVIEAPDERSRPSDSAL